MWYCNVYCMPLGLSCVNNITFSGCVGPCMWVFSSVHFHFRICILHSKYYFFCLCGPVHLGLPSLLYIYISIFVYYTLNITFLAVWAYAFGSYSLHFHICILHSKYNFFWLCGLMHLGLLLNISISLWYTLNKTFSGCVGPCVCTSVHFHLHI